MRGTPTGRLRNGLCGLCSAYVVEETVSKAEATITGQRNAAIAIRALLPTQRDQDV